MCSYLHSNGMAKKNTLLYTHIQSILQYLRNNTPHLYIKICFTQKKKYCQTVNGAYWNSAPEQTRPHTRYRADRNKAIYHCEFFDSVVLRFYCHFFAHVGYGCAPLCYFHFVLTNNFRFSYIFLSFSRHSAEVFECYFIYLDRSITSFISFNRAETKENHTEKIYWNIVQFVCGND